MTDIVVRQIGTAAYGATVNRMREYTDSRDEDSTDELWILQHPPVFTLGQSADQTHVLRAGEIPVVQTDRGGQVTYHGPGQLVIYVLVNLKRRGIGVRAMVQTMENAVIDLLATHDIDAVSRRDAPGVYVSGKKIAALGLRVRRGCTFHGLSLNVDMDLSPFADINPCGYVGLEVTQLKDEGVALTVEQAGERLSSILCDKLTSPVKAS